MIIVLHEWEKFFYRILQKFTKIYTYMVFTKFFFGYDKAQIKREAKKNDSTDSNDKK